MRLLIAEDDADIAKALTALFEHHSYSTDTVFNGLDACEYACGGEYDGIIMDIMMPGMDGLEVLRRLRSLGVKTPVLLLTAKGEVEDRISGLDAGADDYLPKPFAAGELLALVRAMLRRRENYQADLLQFADICLDSSTYELSCGSRHIRLTSREFQMLCMLLRSPGSIVSTQQLMERIWGWDSNVEISIVWVYISNLRKKLETLESVVGIRAVRGVGYCLENPLTRHG